MSSSVYHVAPSFEISGPKFYMHFFYGCFHMPPAPIHIFFRDITLPLLGAEYTVLGISLGVFYNLMRPDSSLLGSNAVVITLFSITLNLRPNSLILNTDECNSLLLHFCIYSCNSWNTLFHHASIYLCRHQNIQ